MLLLREPEYVKHVKQANTRGFTYQPELYKDKFDGLTGCVKRQKLPRPIFPTAPTSNG